MPASESLSVRAIFAVWWANFRTYKHDWHLNLLPHFFEPVLYLLSMGFGLGTYVREMAGVSYAQFLAPALVVMSVINGASFETSYNIYVKINKERLYDAILTTPVSEFEIVSGEILWAVTRATIYGAAFLVVACLFRIPFAASVWWVLPLIPCIGYFFATCGMTYCMMVTSIESFSIYWTLFITPMTLFGDTFFPLADRLPHWAMPLANVLPIFHAVRLTRALWIGDLHPALLWHAAYLLIGGALLHYFAYRKFCYRLHHPAR